MGWGTKKGAAPQPVEEALDPQGNTAILTRHIQASTGMARDQAESKARTLTGEHDDKPSDSAKAQSEWHQLKSRKGWTDATLLMLFYEFIQGKELFTELLAFAKKRK